MLGVFAPLIGCGSRADITLRQPTAPRSQRTLNLVADRAVRIASDGRQRCFLTFPLPGADAGPRAFVLYFCGPDQLGDLRVDHEDPAAVHGFLIQEVGALAGRTNFETGVIRCDRPWYGRSRRKLEFDVRCEDGTLIRGAVSVEVSPREVRSFEQKFAGDVALVQSPEARSDSPQMTEPREAADR
jgi:hypothetical protein